MKFVLPPLEPKGSKALKAAVLSAYERFVPASVSSDLPWVTLEAVVKNLPPNSSMSDVLTAIKNRDVVALLECASIDVSDYTSPRDYLARAVATSFLKKYPFGKQSPIDTEAVAIKRWRLAEQLCKVTNRRLRFHRESACRNPKWAGVRALIPSIRKEIARVIGEAPDLEKIGNLVRHGPGGCIGVAGTATTAYYKYDAERYSVTQRALPYAEALILTDRRWCDFLVARKRGDGFEPFDASPWYTKEEALSAIDSALEGVNYNKVTFVTKDARTDRAIAIEPHMNVYLQLGVGTYLRKLLKKAGLDLDVQADVNRHWAKLGSNWKGPIWFRPCTIDLSMASDTVSIETVRELLPEKWFELLDHLRSRFGLLGNELVRYEKFSSMGNGYTFELESLIFLCVLRACYKHVYGRRDKGEVAAFGDDLIVPFGSTALSLDVLRYLGFRVNTEKSFFIGPFRESCGEDYFDGVPVRPFFLKRELRSAKDLIFVSNMLLVHSKKWAEAGLHVDGGEARAVIGRHIPRVIAEHLHGPISDDPEGHLFVAGDVALQSPLVHWDRFMQCWSYASVRSSAKIFTGRIQPRYLQFRDTARNSVVRLDGALSGYQPEFERDILTAHRKAGGSSGDVTRRAMVQRRVARVIYPGGDLWS